jgi:glycosyltransferase involved in cell wall biosynthesis
VRYVDTGAPTRALRAVPDFATRRALHLFHITRLWRAIILAPVFAVLRGRTVVVLHSGSTQRQLDTMRLGLQWALRTALLAYDEIWAVNDEIGAVLPAKLRDRVTVVTPFDMVTAGTAGRGAREPHAMALATNSGQEHYNAKLGIEAARLIRAEWPDATLVILGYGSDGPELDSLRALVAAEPWVSVHFDLSPVDVTAVLNRVGTFLRPTSWDGDSVIVHEAIECGARVVASDVSPRPRGVELARLNAQALADAVLYGGAMSDGSRLASTTLADAAEAALARLPG